jgi:hypothetical protein
MSGVPPANWHLAIPRLFAHSINVERLFPLRTHPDGTKFVQIEFTKFGDSSFQSIFIPRRPKSHSRVAERWKMQIGRQSSDTIRV